MATIHIEQWSNSARLPRKIPISATQIVHGDARHIGYVDLAIFISWSAELYSNETLGKAYRIAKTAGLKGPTRSCLAVLTARENAKRFV